MIAEPTRRVVATAAVVDEAAQLLEALPPADQSYTGYRAVVALLPKITEARARGHRLDAIVESLARAGITLSVRTLSRYLSRARREAAQRVREPAEQPTL